MAKACGASDVESRIGEALGLGLRADGDAAWAPLVLAMDEIERLPQGTRRCAECLFFRRMTSRLPIEGML